MLLYYRSSSSKFWRLSNFSMAIELSETSRNFRFCLKYAKSSSLTSTMLSPESLDLMAS
jgi:hypothetical protein